MMVILVMLMNWLCVVDGVSCCELLMIGVVLMMWLVFCVLSVCLFECVYVCSV